MESLGRIGDMIAERYELIRQLGAGASGQVFEAQDRFLNGTHVAVKLLFPALIANEAAVARFRNEAAVTRELAHPGIVQTYDFGRSDQGSYYLVMELIQGQTLRQFIDAHPQGVESGIAINILLQLAEAMGVAHRFGVVHRDLKPENVLIDDELRVRVADFGVATQQESLSSLTVSGEMIGTLQYMAPEQLSGKRVDARSDVFALGLIAYELLSGSLPWTNKDAADVLRRFSRRRLVVRDFSSELPLELLNVIDRALEVDPRRRWSDADALRDALLDISAPRKKAFFRRTLLQSVRVAKLRRMLQRVGAVLLVVVLFSLGVGLLDQSKTLQTTGLMLVERFTGVSMRPLLSLVGIDAEYSEEAMIHCVTDANLTCVGALTYAGMSPNLRDADGRPLLHLAVRRTLEFLTQVLISAGADLNAVDRKGRTALMTLYHATRAGGPDSIGTFLSFQPDLLVRDNEGRSALWYAAALGRADLWEQLTNEIQRRYGLEKLREEVNQRDRSGLPLIHLLVAAGAKKERMHFLTQIFRFPKGGIDVNAVAPDGLTPLMRTRYVRRQYSKMLEEELLAAGADPKLRVGERALNDLPGESTSAMENEGNAWIERQLDSLEDE